LKGLAGWLRMHNQNSGWADAVDEVLHLVNVQIEEERKPLPSFEGNVNALHRKLTPLSRLTSVEDRLDGFEEDLADLKSDVIALLDSSPFGTDLAKRVGRLERKMAELHGNP
jgi:hypothetical protein